ncbi:uncharacterized protein LOC114538983 [Dendronephthya gigantea]|uniref:uncharacterized protein LOC114538983 n=1 Tax=Dendronephthya gigantea TaxID=151771 RepID=UPI00106CC35D|nr:uncharacterized protein LOC114538983 [Dendronephthya gigantea]
MTKEMSASHREDILSDALYYYTKRQRLKTVLLLRVQHKRCQELSNSACIELEDLRKKTPVPVTDEMVTEWKQREKEYLRKSRPEEVDLGPHNWVLEYFSLLRQYYSARNQVSEGVDDSRYNHVMAVMSSLNNRLLRMETEHGIQSRWTPTSEQYLSTLRTQEAVNAKQTLDMILISGRRRWFLLSLKKNTQMDKLKPRVFQKALRTKVAI